MICLPRWLDDEFHGRGLAFAAVGGMTLLLAGWLAWAQWSQPDAPTLPAVAGRAAPAPAWSAASTLAAASATVEEPSPATHCPHQHVDITGPDGLQRGCVSATRTRQTGSVRSHVVEPEGVSAWRLAVDTAGGQVISARLSRPAQGPTPAAFYVCEAPACQGIALGRPDARGVRLLSLDEVALQALPPGQKWQRRPPGAAPRPPAASGPALPSVHLSARLQTLPDRQNPALACSLGGVSVVEGDGALTDFCPMGGAGFELADDGRPRFEFRTLEGQSLVVALAADGSIEQVSLGALRCKAPACGGITMQAAGDPADPAVARRFDFSGSTLKAAKPATASATLNGSLSMPSQE